MLCRTIGRSTPLSHTKRGHPRSMVKNPKRRVLHGMDIRVIRGDENSIVKIGLNIEVKNYDLRTHRIRRDQIYDHAKWRN